MFRIRFNGCPGECGSESKFRTERRPCAAALAFAALLRCSTAFSSAAKTHHSCDGRLSIGQPHAIAFGGGGEEESKITSAPALQAALSTNSLSKHFSCLTGRLSALDSGSCNAIFLRASSSVDRGLTARLYLSAPPLSTEQSEFADHCIPVTCVVPQR